MRTISAAFLYSFSFTRITYTSINGHIVSCVIRLDYCVHASYTWYYTSQNFNINNITKIITKYNFKSIICSFESTIYIRIMHKSILSNTQSQLHPTTITHWLFLVHSWQNHPSNVETWTPWSNEFGSF